MSFSQDFEVIRKDRMGVVNSSVYPGLKTLVSQIYPDEAHFIYELLQNAEDAQATEVEFFIRKSKLIFAHNGTRQFDADDVEAITNIAHSTKKDNYVQAGKFGIGFKSVYAFTDTPSIYCDSICFKIEKLLLPTEIEPLKGKKEGWTQFHFPFNSPKISAEDAKQKIKQGLLEIENTTLLFLNNICSIVYTLEDGTKSQVKKTVDGNVISSAVYSGGKRKAFSTWKRFSRIATLHGKKISVDLAFPMEYDKENKLKFVPGSDKVCITFLAKNEKSNLKFYLNAPFGCTPARDTVNKEDKDNQLLMRELAILVQDVLKTLKEENLLTDEFFNMLPIPDDDIPEFYMPLVEAFSNGFKKKSYLPTMDEQYVTVGNGIMSSRSVIDKSFTIKDIQTLFDNKNLQFVKNRPVNSRAYKFLKSLEIEELTPASVLQRMTEIKEDSLKRWIKSLTTKQLSEVYAYLNKGMVDILRDYEKYDEYSYYADSYYANNSYYKEEHQYALIYKRVEKELSKIKQLQIVRGTDGILYKPEDIRILKKKITVPDEYHLVDGALIGKADAESFLKNIGVKEFTEKELEKYLYDQETSDFVKKMNSITAKDDPLEIARMILKFFSEHKESEVSFGTTKYVWTTMMQSSGKDRRSVIASPKECYLDAPYVEETGFRYAETVHKKKGVSEVYTQLKKEELQKWIDFLKGQGIHFTFSIEYQNYSTGYATGYHTNYTMANLNVYLNLKNPAINRFIWKFMCENWRYSYAYETTKINRNYSSRTNDSAVLSALKTSAWIMGKDGKFRTPTKISEKSIADDWIINNDNGFLSVINFGAEQKKIDDEIQKKQELERLQQESKKEAAETLGFDSAEAVMEAQESSKKLQELASYGIDVDELLASKRKEREVKKYTLQEQLQQMRQNEFKANEVYDDGEVYRVPNPERRQSKIHEEISEEKAPQKKTTITRKTAVNQEEKIFVGTEYSGRCQICDKVIFKKDGTRHFVAINLLDTGHLSEEYLQGLSTGWNTLCLCPNCAAEYKYGAVSFFDFEEKVKETEVDKNYRDFYEFTIQMQGEERILRYTPRHIISLQTALRFFAENRDQDVVDEENSDVVGGTFTDDALVVVKSGDRCPDCGVSNIKNEKIIVLDSAGKKQTIECRKCACGKVYLTKKLKKSLPETVKYVEVVGIAPVNKPKKNPETIAKYKGGQVYVPKKRIGGSPEPEASRQRCPKCGSIGLFGGKGMCWDCYKDLMSSRFD